MKTGPDRCCAKRANDLVVDRFLVDGVMRLRIRCTQCGFEWELREDDYLIEIRASVTSL